MFSKKHLLGWGLATVVAAVPALGNETIEFDITNGKVVPSESFAAKVTVLGTAISAGSTHVPVTVQAQIGDTVLEPWGSYGSTAGDVNDSSGIRHYIYNEQLDAGEEIVVSGQSWLYGCSYLAVDSNEETRQVKVLRNGDLAPSISGFNGQSDADDYIREYLEGGTVNIHENQVIYLFELGTTNLNSGAADFQDLVVLVTLGESVEALQPTQTNPLYD